MSTALRDELGARLRYRQEPTGTWTGACHQCGDHRAVVSSASWTCPSCGTMTLEGMLALSGMEGDERPDHPDVPDDAEDFPPFVPASEARDGPPPAFLFDGFMIDGEITQATGDGGSGKTTVALALAGAAAGGYAAFDRFASHRQGPVMVVSEEDGAGVIANRLEALCAGHGWDREGVMGSVHILARAGARLTSREWQEHILEAAREIEPVLIVFDPLAELIDGDENSNSDARPAIRYLRKLTEEIGVAVLVLHHAGKKGDGKRKIDRSVRGASAWNAAARGIYFVEAVEGGISLETVKLSRAEPPQPFVLTRSIQTAENPAVWASARLTWRTVREANESLAERAVLGVLTSEPGPNSTEVRNLASDRGVDPRRASEALSALHEAGRVDYVPGPRNARRWYRLDPASPSAKTAENDPASQDHAGSPHPAYAGNAGSPERPCDPAPPLGGSAGSGGRLCACGNPIGPTAEMCASCQYPEATA